MGNASIAKESSQQQQEPMRAAVFYRYGDVSVVSVGELNKPIPKDKEVLIKVHSASVTPPDMAFRSGSPFVARLFTGLSKPQNPVLGFNLAGEVESVGSAVSKFKPGDRVFGAADDGGAHAQYITMPETAAITHMPDNMSFDEAAASVDGFLTSIAFLRDNAKLGEGQSVLINGAAGSLGSTGIQIAKKLGATVWAVCGSANEDYVRGLGADHVIDYTKEDFTGKTSTFHVIYDAVGKSSFSAAKSALKPNGVYINTNMKFGVLMQMAWTGVVGDKKCVFEATGLRDASDKLKDLALLKDWLHQGAITPQLTKTFKLDEIRQAHELVDSGHKRGNIVVCPQL